ncbi:MULTISPECIES: glycosyltransferase [Thermomonospora]|uniref:Glycosyltransferase involved in cell wall biosynthesis n=1 Tax=Thermomonospora cellulosilytica TaxID=1411118 RepID=A0A7W3MZJ5_9ACTN|nr:MULTISPECIES: glycosyltransferase [Thermomonospora]MBA9004774.1 glycosyltransferase involved in cell wall biosynthesis [Thermomonospora cellulosilytica]
MPSSSLNIALVTLADLSNEPAAGVHAVHVTELARALGQQGHRVTVYTRRTDESARPRVRLGAGATVEHLDVGPALPLDEAGVLPHVKAFTEELARRLSQGRQRPDLVHAHGWLGGLAAYAAVQDTGIPLVQSFHGLGVVENRRPGGRRTVHPARIRIERALGRGVTRVLAGCDHEADELVRMGVARPQITVVPYGVDGERFRQTGPTMPRGRRPRLVMVCGDLENGGVATAIRALVHVPDAELVVAGGPSRENLETDPVVQRLTTLAKELHVSDRTLFLGRLPRKDVPKLLRTARLALCLAPHQPSGMTPLEAMACGVPVVTVPAGASADSVLDGVTGLHVPAGQPVAIGRALRRLLGEETTLSAWAIAAADRAHSRYAWERIGAETVRAYAGLLPEPEPEPVAEEHQDEEEPVGAGV